MVRRPAAIASPDIAAPLTPRSHPARALLTPAHARSRPVQTPLTPRSHPARAPLTPRGLSAAVGRRWERVREAQLKQTDHWEMQYADGQYAGRPFWINWVTGEKRWTKPAIEPVAPVPTGDAAAEGLAKDCEE